MALHDDVLAEGDFLGPQGRQRLALGGVDQALRHGKAAGGEQVGVEREGHGDILPRPAFFFYPRPA